MSQVFAALRAPRAVFFGVGQRHGIGRAVAALGATALVCTDPRMAGESVFAEILDDLSAHGVAPRVFAEVEAELPVETLVAAAARFRTDPPDVLLAVGGGSCLDHAKVMATLLTHGGHPRDYYGEHRVPGPVRPVVAVPTTAGTGSEVTPVAVVTDDDRPTKVGLSSPHLIPHTAIVDPELTRSCPPRLTAHSGVDALAHCLEAFTAIRRDSDSRLPHEQVFVGAGPLTDTWALAGLELIGRGLVRAVEDGSDEAARADMALAALYGGLAFGTAGTAGAHAIQYPVGALTHTAHGLGVGLLLPYLMEFNLPVRVAELSRVADVLAPDPASPGPGLPRARAAIDAVEALLRAVGIPRSLAEIGLAHSELDTVARLALVSARLVQNNPRPLSPDAVDRIVRAAHAGQRDGLAD